MHTTHAAASANALNERLSRIRRELSEATARLPSDTLTRLARGVAVHFVKAMARRGIRLASVLRDVGVFTAREAGGLVVSSFQRRAKHHIRSRGQALRNWGQVKGAEARKFGAQWVRRLVQRPTETLCEVVIGAMGMYLGSGGVDGDGGIPDMDLIAGIGHHRSIWTHSIIPGALIETGVVAAVALTRAVHVHLPDDHDPLWDALQGGGEIFAGAFGRGVSLGIAYHLGTDGMGDITPYKDLPLSMSMTGHRIVMEANAAAEAVGHAREPRAEAFEHVREPRADSGQKPRLVVLRASSRPGARKVGGFRGFARGVMAFPASVRECYRAMVALLVKIVLCAYLMILVVCAAILVNGTYDREWPVASFGALGCLVFGFALREPATEWYGRAAAVVVGRWRGRRKGRYRL
jgi:hypothetical protein